MADNTPLSKITLMSGVVLMTGALQPPTESVSDVAQNPGFVAAPDVDPEAVLNPNPAAVLEEVAANPGDDGEPNGNAAAGGGEANNEAEGEFEDLPDLEAVDNGNGDQVAGAAGDGEEPEAV